MIIIQPFRDSGDKSVAQDAAQIVIGQDETFGFVTNRQRHGIFLLFLRLLFFLLLLTFVALALTHRQSNQVRTLEAKRKARDRSGRDRYDTVA